MIILLFFLNFYSETLSYRPSSMHQWRQADCLSITKNYYEEGMHFFSPKIHSLRAPGGKAVSEFPLLSYTVAFLWKIFGEHEIIYRLLEYLLYLAAVFVFLNTLLRFFTPGLYYLFMVSLLLTSPLLTYYSVNFLSDVPALSLCIISFCLLFRFYKTKAVTYFYLSLLLATLAVLLKASALVTLVCLGFFALADLLGIGRWLGIDHLFKRKLVPVLSLALAVFLIDAWYSFALRYNTYNNGVFLLTVLPIWEMAEDEVFNNLRLLFNDLLPSFLNRPMLTLFFFMVLFVAFHFKKLDVFLRGCFVFSAVFFILFILFFFQVFTVHDYYLVNLFIFPVITMFCVADITSKMAVKPNRYLKTAFIVLFIFNGFYSAAHYRLRTIKDDKLCVWYPFISKDEKTFFKYQKWMYSHTLKPLETIQPDLRRLGISRTDTVASVMDNSPNISLYFMDQKGYTFSQEQYLADSLSMEKIFRRGVRYIVFTDTMLKREKPFRKIAPFYECILKKSNIQVLKRKDLKHAV